MGRSQRNHLEKLLLFLSEHSSCPAESLHYFLSAKARRTAYGAVRRLGVYKGSASDRSLCLWASGNDCPPVDCQRVYPPSKALYGLALPIAGWRDLRSAINRLRLGRGASRRLDTVVPTTTLKSGFSTCIYVMTGGLLGTPSIFS